MQVFESLWEEESTRTSVLFFLVKRWLKLGNQSSRFFSYFISWPIFFPSSFLDSLCCLLDSSNSSSFWANCSFNCFSIWAWCFFWSFNYSWRSSFSFMVSISSSISSSRGSRLYLLRVSKKSLPRYQRYHECTVDPYFCVAVQKLSS